MAFQIISINLCLLTDKASRDVIIQLCDTNLIYISDLGTTADLYYI